MSQTVNYNLLNIDHHQHHINRLIDSALSAADPAAAVSDHISLTGSDLRIGETTYDTAQGSIFVIAVGKASLPMITAATNKLGVALHKGIAITKSNTQEQLSNMLAGIELPPNVTAFGAGHPSSDSRSVAATGAVIDLVAQAREADLVLCLISGGASALLTQPILPLPDWGQLVNALLASGCTINEINGVRKRLDTIKGGGLARLASPAICVSLILSDVVGNPLDIIGSGPTVVNRDPPDLALRILHRYHMDTTLPPDLWSRISERLRALPVNNSIEKTQVSNIIIGDVRLAALAAERAARQLGFTTHLLTAHLEGEAREVGRVAAALAKDAPAGSCLILGGETTVTLRGHGKGGRNQELALSAAIALEGITGAIVASFSTDGDDGPTDAAGAIASGAILSNARAVDIEAQAYLDNNDSYNFFDQVGGLIKTGQTGTNVNDLLFILKYD